MPSQPHSTANADDGDGHDVEPLRRSSVSARLFCSGLFKRAWSTTIGVVEGHPVGIARVVFIAAALSVLRMVSKYTIVPLLRMYLHIDGDGGTSWAMWIARGLTGDHASYAVSSFVCERLIGVAFTLAWISTHRQLHALVGEMGILPARDTMEALARRGVSLRQFPSIFWYGNSDLFIHSVCAVGISCAMAFTLDIAPCISMAICTILYLSVKCIGMEFYALQWDNLMIELGAITTVLAIQKSIGMIGFPSTSTQDLPLGAAMAYWCLWWLAFRLNFCSGIVKILSRDVSWRNGTALDYHMWTQPLPSFPAWYVWNYFPQWSRMFGVYGHFFIELVVPMGMFISELHVPAAIGMISLQVGIAMMGNYGFFNYVTGILALSMVPDWVYPVGVAMGVQAYQQANKLSLLRVALLHTMDVGGLVWTACYAMLGVMGVAYVAYVMLASLKVFESTFRHAGLAQKVLPHWSIVSNALRLHHARRYSLVNYYGLFARMTRYRHEIILEGSMDGSEWKEYIFRYKPSGPVHKDPLPFTFPGHMPRVDWRLWFLPLRGSTASPPKWFAALMLRVLQGQEQVLRVFAQCPFSGVPPTFLRAKLYRYEFDCGDEDGGSGPHNESLQSPTPWERGGGYWKRMDLGKLYCPVAMLSNDDDDDRICYVTLDHNVE